MNSAQRRQARREYPHRVSVKAQMNERYHYHDSRVEQGRHWCCKQFKRGSWRTIGLWDETIFYFANEKDATYFALKWA